MESRILRIKELTFSAAHYISNHPKCGNIHGHTYYVRNLEMLTSGFVDFGDIKRVVMALDHKFLIPKADEVIWRKLQDELSNMVFKFDFAVIDGDPTAENISEKLAMSILALEGVENLRFELYEGPNCGVKVEM